MKNLIPVIVDSIKQIEGFENTRCIYYRIEFEDNFFQVSQDIEQELSGTQFIMGTWAILAHPIQAGQQNPDLRFLTPEIIEDTFNYINESKNLSLEFGHIWIPNQAIHGTVKLDRIRDGDVIRISDLLFSVCYRYSANLINEKTWLSAISQFSKAIVLSEKETAAFRLWRKSQIEKSIERYRSKIYQGLRLQKKNITK